MHLQLVVIAGPDKNLTLPLFPGENLMLGRGHTAAYRLSDLSVSRNHAQIELEGDRVTIIDNGGKGGLLINGNPVKRHTLKPGDIVGMGGTQLRFQIGELAGTVANVATPDTANAVRQRAFAPPDPPRSPGQEVAKLADLYGKTIAHFELGYILGQGRTSMVFLAHDTKNGRREVALKVLLPEFSNNEDDMKRFVRAMKTAMPLRHPNLVSVYGAGKSEGHCWVAMEYIAGEVLTQTIERLGVAGMLDWRNAYRVAAHIGRALDYAHRKHIIHRNISPTNIWLQATDKQAKLSNLMLAKALEGPLAQQITRPGELVGDLTYMSPERTRGDLNLVDGRSDLYSLGATIYALLTGRPPFEGSTLVERINRIRNEEPIKPTRYQLAIPHRFEGLILELLAKRPDDRYQTAEDVVAELEMIGMMHGLSV